MERTVLPMIAIQRSLLNWMLRKTIEILVIKRCSESRLFMQQYEVKIDLLQT